MKEIWKPVKDFEKYYMISNKGNVKNIEQVKSMINEDLLNRY